MYETKRHKSGTGNASTKRGCAASKGSRCPKGCVYGGGFARRGVALERHLRASRRGGAASKASVRCQAETFGEVSEALGENTLERAISARVSDRPLDVAACREGNREALWRKVPSRSRVASASGYELELSEAGAAGTGAQRGSDRTLAQEGLAAYKKKPVGSAQALRFLTRAALCCSLFAAGLGHRGERHRFNAVPVHGVTFLQSQRLWFPRCAAGWDSISRFTSAASALKRRSLLCFLCDAVFAAASFSFLSPQCPPRRSTPPACSSCRHS